MNRLTYLLTALFALLITGSAYGNEQQSDSDSSSIKNEAAMAMQVMQTPEKMIEQLTPGHLYDLPLYTSRTVSNSTYKVAFTNARFYETYAELTAYASVPIPQGPTLLFGISGLKLSYEGGFIGTARLTLLGDVPISFNGGNASIILRGSFDIKSGRAMENLTYMEIDCSGFKEVGITADVVFPRSMIVPCDSLGKVSEKGNVQGRFSTTVQDWNDILVDISLPAFQMNGLKDVIFSIQRAMLDFSDMRNGNSVHFPENYQGRYMMLPDLKMWRGLFINNLTVTLPKAFNSDSTRATFEANDMLIDNNGISGNFIATNILRFEKGNASGWHFSVNQFYLGLEANTMVKAGFSGNIALPIAENDTLKYTAIIAANNKYLIKVEMQDTMDVKLWNANMRLDPNSWIKLELDGNRFLPEAMLYGRLDVEPRLGENGKPLGKFKGITFKALHLQARAPYLTVEYLGYQGTISVANFPASIENIAFTANAANASLSFGLNLTLMDNVFKGATRINLLAKLETHDGFHRWVYDRCNISSIKIDNANLGGLSISGEAAFLNDDEVYGDGFGGVINLKLEALASVEVQVRARFGKTDFRYWFVDGFAEFSPGFQVSILNIDGLSGGAYYRMSKMKDKVSNKGMPEYKPDKTFGLGVKFGIMFKAVNAAAPVLDGQVEFEIAFNSNGGLNYIGLFGNGLFLGQLPGPVGKALDKATALYNKAQDKMGDALEGLSDAAKLDKIKALEQLRTDKPTDAAKTVETGFKVEDGQFNGLAAYFGISYDFQANAFHASFEVYINAAKGLLQGVGQNYRAGWAEIHSEPGRWHIFMGTPSDPVGVKFGLGNFNIRTESYFMAGTDIPGSPPPPQEIADILHLDPSELDYMRELNNLGEGKGLAFGAHLTVETGDITFLILYANFSAGLGFDLMLKNYDGAHCEGSNEPIGINGWYANAQAYAFFQGELGVKVNLWFIKARFPIIKGAAAALMQAKLPNPSWFRGYLGVEFSLLGGLVSGDMRFKLEFGHECKIVNADGSSSPVGIAVISDMSPKDGNNVDVFAAPQAAFNFPVGKEILISDDQGDKIYRVEMEQFMLHANGQSVAGTLKWNSKMDAVSFYSKEILPPNTSVTASVKVSFKEKKGVAWQTVYMDGKKAEETKTISFTTGAAPEEVPLTNIAYCWPTVEQHNFYRGESAQGFIQLKRGQKYLFDAQGITQELLVAKAGGERQFTSFRYNETDCRIDFTIPAVELSSDYALAVVNKSSGPASKDGSLKATETTTDDGAYATLNKEAMSFSREDIAKTILEYPFHSSAYNFFSDKVNAAQPIKTVLVPYSSSVVSMVQQVAALEPFDLNELTGTMFTDEKPLVQPVAVLDDQYFQSVINPLVYQRYPIDNSIRFDRDTSIYGTVPARALPVLSNYQTSVEQGNLKTIAVIGQLPYMYDLPKIYQQDYFDLKTKVVNRFLGTARQKDFAWIIESYFPFINHGYYNVRYQFVLPNGKKGSSTVVQYFNPIL